MKTKANDEPEVVYWVEYENGAIGVWTSFGWHWGGEGGANQIPTALYIPGYGWARRKVREAFDSYMQSLKDVPRTVEEVRV